MSAALRIVEWGRLSAAERQRIASLGGRGAYIGKVRNDQLGQVFAHDMRAALPAVDAAIVVLAGSMHVKDFVSVPERARRR